MLRDGYFDARPADDALGAEADQACQAPARTAFHNPVEIDETDRFAIAVRMRHARTQPAGHERQVRVGIFRLRGALYGVEIGAAIELVVLVAGTLRKECAERVDEGGDVLFAQPRGNAAIEETGGGVRRPI